MAQLVKSLPAMQETRDLSPGWEDPLEKEWQPTLALLPGNPKHREAWWATSPRGPKSQMRLLNRKNNSVSNATRLDNSN